MMQDLCQTTCLDFLELWLASGRVNDAMVGMKRKSEKTSSTTMRNPETTTYQCTMIVLNHVPPKKNLCIWACDSCFTFDYQSVGTRRSLPPCVRTRGGALAIFSPESLFGGSIPWPPLKPPWPRCLCRIPDIPISPCHKCRMLKQCPASFQRGCGNGETRNWGVKWNIDVSVIALFKNWKNNYPIVFSTCVLKMEVRASFKSHFVWLLELLYLSRLSCRCCTEMTWFLSCTTTERKLWVRSHHEGLLQL